MSALVENFKYGTLSAGISDVDTTISSANFANLQTVSSPDTMKIVLDPESEFGDPEIVEITTHTTSSTSVTVTRGVSGTTARSHSSGVFWVMATLAEDLQRMGFEGTATLDGLTVDTDTLHVDAANNRVGIGTTTPDAELDIEADSPTIRLTDSDTALSDDELAGAIEFYTNDTNAQGVSAYIHADGDGSTGAMNLRLGTGAAGAAADRMTIDSTGNVGIGTTAPTYLLDIDTGSLGGTSGDTLDAQRWYTEAGANDTFVEMRAERLATGTDWTTAVWRLQHQVDSTPMAFVQFNGDPSSMDRGLQFGTNDIVRMSIEKNGKVGIGTESPGAELDIETNDPMIRLTSTNTAPSNTTLLGGVEWYGNDASLASGIGAYIHADARTTDGAVALRFGTGYQGSATDSLTIDYDGFVGIGTTGPQSELDMSDGSIAFGTDASANALGGPFGIEVYSNDTIGSAASLEGALYYRTTPNVWVFEDGAGADILSMDTDDLSATFGGRITSLQTYNNTASATSVVIDSAGLMSRSSSSLKYKTDVETMHDEHADALLDLRPVWFRSLNERDPDVWSYWGFIAEEVAEIDPRLVHFGVPDDYEWQYDEKGNRIYPDVVDLTEPEDVRYSHMVPHLVNLAKRQKAAIEAQKAAIEALEQRIATLEAN